jgi:2-polyprenyl-6-methoxyphenol hydroxylase-like FAD-dependent oxidoreductase
MSNDCDVLVVGAGPTGLVLALELALRGVRVRIVDRSAGPGTASRAMVVHARTLELYRRFGLAEEVVSRGMKVERAHLRDGGREMARFTVPDLGRGLSPYPFLLSFPQDEHEKVLGEFLRDAGVNIEWTSEVLSFEEKPDGIVASLAPGG